MKLEDRNENLGEGGREERREIADWFRQRQTRLILQDPTEQGLLPSPILTISKARPEEEKGLGVDSLIKRDKKASASG